MPKFFVTNEQIHKENIEIKGQDVKHISKVLRLIKGEHIEICNINTQENFLCEIDKIQDENVYCKILENIEKKTESNVKVTVFQGLPKADKMEYVIQKSIELGVQDITPIEMKRCVIKLNDKDKSKKIQRWQKISEVAAKQCGRDIIPKINEISNIKEIVNLINEYDVLLIAYEKEQKNTLKHELDILKNKKENFKIGILIGPEGGIDEQEVEILAQNGAKIITLGKRILRTETVALNMLSIIMYELEK